MKLKLIYASVCMLAVLQGCKKEETSDNTVQINENSTSKGSAKTLAAPPTNVWVSLIAKHNGKALQLPGFNTDNGTSLQQWTSGPGPNYRFKLTSVGTGIYRITPSMSYGLSQAVEVTAERTDDGAPVVQYTWNGGTHQQWRAIDRGNGYFSFINVNSGKAMDIPSASPDNGTKLTQYTASSTAANQQFSMVQRGATTVNVNCNGCEPWFPSAVAGSWIMMHWGDNLTLRNDGGTSQYVARYETEYWLGSGAYVRPQIQVLSGTNTRTSQTGQTNPGTCTGTPLPQEELYTLNGTVKWTNVESGCSYNIAMRTNY